MIALGVILMVFLPTCLTLGDYCIIGCSLRCLRHSALVIYRSKLPSPSVLTTIAACCKVKYNSKLYLSFWILYKDLFLVDGSSLSLWGGKSLWSQVYIAGL